MAEQNNNQQDLNQLLQVRYDKLHELQENGKDPFVITKYDVTSHSTDIVENFDTMEGKPVSIAGRMMFKRVMGKASFCNIQDFSLFNWLKYFATHPLCPLFRCYKHHIIF